MIAVGDAIGYANVEKRFLVPVQCPLTQQSFEAGMMKIASDPATDPDELTWLQELFYYNNAIGTAIAGNPNTPVEVLIALSEHYPDQFLDNPVLPFLFIENANFASRFTEKQLRILIGRDKKIADLFRQAFMTRPLYSPTDYPRILKSNYPRLKASEDMPKLRPAPWILYPQSPEYQDRYSPTINYVAENVLTDQEEIVMVLAQYVPLAPYRRDR